MGIVNSGAMVAALKPGRIILVTEQTKTTEYWYRRMITTI